MPAISTLSTPAVRLPRPLPISLDRPHTVSTRFSSSQDPTAHALTPPGSAHRLLSLLMRRELRRRSDNETFISADDLRINLWNLGISDTSFNIVDIKPANMEVRALGPRGG